MKKIIPLVLIIIGFGLIIISFLIPNNSANELSNKDNKEINTNEKSNSINYDSLNSILINNSYSTPIKIDKYDAVEGYLWKSAGKIVDGKEVDGDVEVYYLVYENKEQALEFFNNFHSDFKHDIKKYADYSVAKYTFGGAITRYCYKVISDKNIIFILSYDKDHYNKLISELGYEKE